MVPRSDRNASGHFEVSQERWTTFCRIRAPILVIASPVQGVAEKPGAFALQSEAGGADQGDEPFGQGPDASLRESTVP